MPRSFLLIGDIGGTNGRFALHAAEDGNDQPLYSKTYQNSKYITAENFSFNELLTPFLDECFEHVQVLASAKSSYQEDISMIACFAVAGPVKQNRAYMSNIVVDIEHVNKNKLVVCGDKLVEESKGYFACIKHCKIINDFQGQGYGTLTLDYDKECVELCKDSREKMNPDGPICCVGAGTGLGECYLTPSSDGYACFASEGGHVDFAPRDEIEFEMLHYLKDKFQDSTKRISVERIVSGKGLANIYGFLAQKYPAKINPTVHEEYLHAGDMQGKVVGVNADEKGSLCRMAFEIFLGAYGAEAGNAALKFLPTGGLFLVGGLTPKYVKHIQSEDCHFIPAYKDKGRVSKILFDDIPLFAVLTEDLGLRGALYCVRKEYKNFGKST